VYRLYDEDGDFMRVVKRKEGQNILYSTTGGLPSFLKTRRNKRQKDLLKHMEESLI